MSVEDEIVVAAEPPKPITATVGGKKYKVRPIKSSLGVSLSQRFQGTNAKDVGKLQESMAHLVGIVFGPTDAKKILARLDDSSDALDYPHIIELMTKLIERSTGNPTT